VHGTVHAVAVSADLSAQVIVVPGIVLTPLTVADAAAMATVLGDPGLYRLTGGSPPAASPSWSSPLMPLVGRYARTTMPRPVRSRSCRESDMRIRPTAEVSTGSGTHDPEYDDRMKRITVSLPDELVDRIKKAAGDGQVSSYVATALADYQERETLAEILTSWRTETPVPDDARRQAAAELDQAGMLARAPRGGRKAS